MCSGCGWKRPLSAYVARSTLTDARPAGGFAGFGASSYLSKMFGISPASVRPE